MIRKCVSLGNIFGNNYPKNKNFQGEVYQLHNIPMLLLHIKVKQDQIL